MMTRASARPIQSIAAGVAAMLLLAAISASVGVAASVAMTTGSIGAARVAPARCVSAPLTLVPTLVGTTWTAVVVSGIPASCAGGTLQLTVNTGATSSSASAVVPAGGGTMTMTLAVAQTVDADMQTDLVVVGP
jgi:hypothetical protein